MRIIVESKPFEYAMLSVIVLCSISMGIQTSKTVQAACGGFFRVLEYVYLAIFTIEACMKLLAYGYLYFLDGWNIFDLLIIIVSFIPSTANISSLRTLRMFKAFRSFKLAEKIPKLRVIIDSVMASGQSLFWIFVIIAIFFYIYALIGVAMFGNEFPSKFGTLAKALYSLFVVMTLEGLASQYARPIGEVYPWSQLYFVTFAIIASYMLMNFIVGIISEALSVTGKAEKRRRYLRKLEEETKDMREDELAAKMLSELYAFKSSLEAVKDSHYKILQLT